MDGLEVAEDVFQGEMSGNYERTVPQKFDLWNDLQDVKPALDPRYDLEDVIHLP